MTAAHAMDVGDVRWRWSSAMDVGGADDTISP
jgi:hypothetical protein